MNKSLVTIAIPAYKAEFLKEAISSALNQTYSNIELVIIDDNSPENIDSIIKEFNDSRIHYYKNAINLGKEDPSKNWNKCLEYANGEYFALLCDDDTYEPNFVKEMLELANMHFDIKVFRSRVKTINENNQVINWYPSSPMFETSLDYMYQKLCGFRRQTISEFFYCTDYIKKLGGFVNMPCAWTADFLSVLYFSQERGIISTQNILVNYRCSKKNISSSHTDAVTKFNALLLFRKKINGYISSLEQQNQQNLLKDALYLAMFSEIVGLCSATSLINICRIFIKGGFPRKWILFIIVNKIGSFGKHK